MFLNKSQYNGNDGNWRDSLIYDANHENDCENAGCDNEGICRCGTITDVRVDSSIDGVDHFFNCSYDDSVGDGLDKVLGHWFTRKNFSKIDWQPDVTGGYYGQELEGISTYNDGGFFNLARGFAEMSHKEKIESLLMQEYGSVLAKIKEVDEWQLKCVFLSDVMTSMNKNLNSGALEHYTKFCKNIVQNLERTNTEFQTQTQCLAPLTLRVDKKYQIIDGRHRIAALSKEYNWETYAQVRGKSGRLKNETTKKTFAPLFVWIICPREK